jgi:hypothetical protein
MRGQFRHGAARISPEELAGEESPSRTGVRSGLITWRSPTSPDGRTSAGVPLDCELADESGAPNISTTVADVTRQRRISLRMEGVECPDVRCTTSGGWNETRISCTLGAPTSQSILPHVRPILVACRDAIKELLPRPTSRIGMTAGGLAHEDEGLQKPTEEGASWRRTLVRQCEAEQAREYRRVSNAEPSGTASGLPARPAMHLGEHLAEELKALDMSAARRGSKLGEKPDEATHRIEPGTGRFSRAFEVDSTRWCPMLPVPK